MSQSATWDTLQIARDARLCGRLGVAAALQDEIDQELPAYSHLYHRKVARRVDAWIGIHHDWLAWAGTHVDARRASVEASKSWMRHTMLPIPYDRDGLDVIEMRMRYYHTSYSGWNGVFAVD